MEEGPVFWGDVAETDANNEVDKEVLWPDFGVNDGPDREDEGLAEVEE